MREGLRFQRKVGSRFYPASELGYAHHDSRCRYLEVDAHEKVCSFSGVASAKAVDPKEDSEGAKAYVAADEWELKDCLPGWKR